jgi:ribosomal protein L29
MIALLTKEFIGIASSLGKSIAGSSMSIQEISGKMQQTIDAVGKVASGTMKKGLSTIDNKLNVTSRLKDNLFDGGKIADARRVANKGKINTQKELTRGVQKDVEKYKKENAGELNEMTDEERSKKLSEVKEESLNKRGRNEMGLTKGQLEDIKSFKSSSQDLKDYMGNVGEALVSNKNKEQGLSYQENLKSAFKDTDVALKLNFPSPTGKRISTGTSTSLSLPAPDVPLRLRTCSPINNSGARSCLIRSNSVAIVIGVPVIVSANKTGSAVGPLPLTLNALGGCPPGVLGRSDSKAPAATRLGEPVETSEGLAGAGKPCKAIARSNNCSALAIRPCARYIRAAAAVTSTSSGANSSALVSEAAATLFSFTCVAICAAFSCNSTLSGVFATNSLKTSSAFPFSPAAA